MKSEIEKAIRKALNRHLVQHVQVLSDTRCRIDILTEEATNEILGLVAPSHIKNSFCICPTCKSIEIETSFCNDKWHGKP